MVCDVASSASCVKASGKGNYALIAVDSLDEDIRAKIIELYPDGPRARLAAWVRENYVVDQNAVVFFHDRTATGIDLPLEKAKEYITNASVLNCCIKLYERAATAQKLFGGQYNWDQMAAVIESLREQFGHTLPASTLRFRKKVAEYKRNGYACLISGKFGNQSARKVNVKIERLICSIAVQPNQPYNTHVCEQYNMFVCGELDVYDPETGELYDMNDDAFVDKNGEPVALSETTVNNILNKPKNRVLIDKWRLGWSTFMHEQMPHMHRHAPEFSFSKITMDDRDLPRKDKETKSRPKAYYCYDVASQCVIGAAYSRKKDTNLVLDCFRDMFMMIQRHGWGCPAEIEVENHLLSQWRDTFLKEDTLFGLVHFCAPQNSQEKYAERMNGAKKTRIEHRNHFGIGRFYAKSRANRVEYKKVFDEYNDTYEDNEYYDWDELIADDRRDCYEFNHTLHPNQKKYKGMTRWDVLVQNMNPTLRPMAAREWARFIGDKVETSIRRNSYCRVAHKDWWLSDVKVMERLEPNNWKVTAYCLPDEEGNVNDVWIYQGETYIDKLQDLGTYNTATVEQTDDDAAIFIEQRKKVSKFNTWVEENNVPRVAVMPRQPIEMPEEPKTLHVAEEPLMDDDMTCYDINMDYARKALEDH